jgi:hypothetical protein
MAQRLMDGTNPCVLAGDNGPAGFGYYAFRSVNGGAFSGAVADLVGDGTPAAASAAIKRLNNPSGPVSYDLPVAYITARTAFWNLIPLLYTFPPWVSRTLCGAHGESSVPVITSFGVQWIYLPASAGDFLAVNYTFADYNKIFNNKDNDGLVSTDSGLNQSTSGIAVLVGVAHGSGTVGDWTGSWRDIPSNGFNLGLGGPHAQEQDSGAPSAVITLLNTPVTDRTMFRSLPRRSQ